MLLLACLGLGSSNGLALALARCRGGCFWTVVGLAILYLRTLVFDLLSAAGASQGKWKYHKQFEYPEVRQDD